MNITISIKSPITTEQALGTVDCYPAHHWHYAVVPSPRHSVSPVLIVSTFEPGKSGFFQGNQTNEVGDGWGAYDNGLSNSYLILKARAMGFDTLIMGMRDADALRKLFEIPENETVMAVISLGYRAGEPNRPERRPLDEIVKFY